MRPSTNASAKSPSKRQRDRQIASVVAVAAADDPQHAELRLAMAAGADAGHAATIAQRSPGVLRVGLSRNGVPYNV